MIYKSTKIIYRFNQVQFNVYNNMKVIAIIYWDTVSQTSNHAIFYLIGRFISGNMQLWIKRLQNTWVIDSLEIMIGG